jgi:hypothetical protein
MLLLKRKNIIFTQLKIGYARKTLISGDSQWIDANRFLQKVNVLIEHVDSSDKVSDLYSGGTGFQSGFWN